MPAIIVLLAASYLFTVYLVLAIAQRGIKGTPTPSVTRSRTTGAP